MKKNKRRAIKKIQKNLRIALAKHYTDTISANIKRAIQDKKTNKIRKLTCKAM